MGKILLKETKNLNGLLGLNTHIKVEMFYNEINSLLPKDLYYNIKYKYKIKYKIYVHKHECMHTICMYTIHV